MSIHALRGQVSRTGLVLSFCLFMAAALSGGVDGGLLHWPWPSATEMSQQAEPVDVDAPRKAAISEFLADKFQKSPEEVRTYVELAFEESNKHPDVTPELILAVIQKESSLDPSARSFYGAVGLMQVVPRFHMARLSQSESLYDASVNIRVGAQILQEYISKAGGDIHAGLKKYSGNARGYGNKVLSYVGQLKEI